MIKSAIAVLPSVDKTEVLIAAMDWVGCAGIDTIKISPLLDML